MKKIKDKENIKLVITIKEDKTLDLAQRENASKATPLRISVPVPSESIITALKDETITKVETNYMISSKVLDNEIIVLEKMLLSKELLTEAKNQKKVVIINVSDNEGKLRYLWNIDGSLLYKRNVSVKDLNLIVNTCNVSDIPSVAKLLNSNNFKN